MYETTTKEEWFVNLDPRDLNDHRGKKIIFIELTEPWSMERVAHMEKAMNEREFDFRTNNRYRILPYGLRIIDQATKGSTDDLKAIVECQYCFRLGARGCECPGCGALIR